MDTPSNNELKNQEMSIIDYIDAVKNKIYWKKCPLTTSVCWSIWRAVSSRPGTSSCSYWS